MTHKSMRVGVSPQSGQSSKRQTCPYSQPVNLYNKERYNRWKPESQFTNADLKKDILAMALKHLDMFGDDEKGNELKLSISKLSSLHRGSSSVVSGWFVLYLISMIFNQIKVQASCHGCAWCDGSSNRSFMLDQLSYFSFLPVLHGWYNKDWYVLSCLWDGAYKRTLAANRKE